jgi:hypothetical protein
MFVPEDIEITTTPIAIALADITAIAESPRILLFSFSRSNKNATIITIGNEKYRGENWNIVAIAKAPKATCESPSPIIAYFFNTNVTPNKEAHSEIRVPTMMALTINV